MCHVAFRLTIHAHPFPKPVDFEDVLRPLRPVIITVKNFSRTAFQKVIHCKLENGIKNFLPDHITAHASRTFRRYLHIYDKVTKGLYLTEKKLDSLIWIEFSQGNK